MLQVFPFVVSALHIDCVRVTLCHRAQSVLICAQNITIGGDLNISAGC